MKKATIEFENKSDLLLAIKSRSLAMVLLNTFEELRKVYKYGDNEDLIEEAERMRDYINDELIERDINLEVLFNE